MGTIATTRRYKLARETGLHDGLAAAAVRALCLDLVRELPSIADLAHMVTTFGAGPQRRADVEQLEVCVSAPRADLRALLGALPAHHLQQRVGHPRQVDPQQQREKAGASTLC